MESKAYSDDFEVLERDGVAIAIRDLSTNRVYGMVAGGEGEDDGNAGDAAGGDAGVSDADDDDGDDDLGATGAEGDGQRDAGDKGEKKTVPLDVFQKRTAKLTAQRNRAREELRQREADRIELATYKKRERDAQKALDDAQRRTPEGQKKQADRRAVVAALDDTLGDGTVDWIQSEKAARAAERERAKEEYGLRGIGYLSTEIEDHGLKADERTLKRWESAVGSELQEDPELLAQYQRPGTQKRAVEEACKRVREGLVNPVLKHAGAKPLERVSRNREALLGNGGRGAIEGAVEPKFDLTPPKELKGRALDEWWADTRSKAWDQLSAQGE